MSRLSTASLAETDPEIAAIIGREVQRRHHRLEEPAPLGETLNQMDPGPGAALQEDGQDQAGQPGARPEIGPAQGVRGQAQKLGAVQGVAGPETGQGRGANKVEPLAPVFQQGPILFQIGHLTGGRAHGGLEGIGLGLRAGLVLGHRIKRHGRDGHGPAGP